MALSKEDLLSAWKGFRWRYVDRDIRFHKIDQIIRGDFRVWDPDGENIESRSPNMIQVAMEDTSEAAGQMPTLRVLPRRNQPSSRKQAERMEYIGASYMDVAEMDLMIPKAVADMAAFGLSAWVVWPDYEQKIPLIEWRDPQTCYPEPGLRPGQKCRRCIFSRLIKWSQLPANYKAALQEFVVHDRGYLTEERKQITLVEYFDEDEYVLGAVLTVNPSSPGYGYGPLGNDPVEIPVILERIPNLTGVCQVVISSRFSVDGDHRGQFDQVTGVLEAHIRLMGLLLDYADQAVYSDVWVKDLIGEMSWGGGAYIELGPQGAIGRVPPAVSSMNVQQDLAMLVDSFHLGSRWPKSRPGEIDQAIASAKFLEATAGMMNTAIKTYHQLLKRKIEHVLRLCFLTDQKYFPGKKMAVGVLRNQEFAEEYDPSTDIDVKHKIRAEYGLGLGRDPSQSAVLMLQYAQQEYISHEFVQENIEGLNDVARERQRIDTQKLKQMAFAQLLQGLQSGSIPDDALVSIYESREKGEDIMQLYKKYVVDAKAAAAQGPQLTMPGPAGAPGPLGAPGGPGPNGAAGPPGGGAPNVPVPPPPGAAQLLQSLATPAGPGQGNMLGVRSGG